MTDLNDLDTLRAELDAFAQPEKKQGRTAREERLLAGFEDIQRFVTRHGHAPRHRADADIFERLYAVRLERLRALEECRTLLAPLDHQGLLEGHAANNNSANGKGAIEAAMPAPDTPDDAELLAALTGASGLGELTRLRHVRSTAEKRHAPEEIANREPCENFEAFRPLFTQVDRELKAGVRKTRGFGKNAVIKVGQWFILEGQSAYVADEGEEFDSPQGKKDARLQVIFSNGTQSRLLRLSLVRALYKDASSRRITEPDVGPLFRDSGAENGPGSDHMSGTIYVLRSRSAHPFVAAHRELIHKIGVTGGRVETRIANAAHDATYLLAEVEVVATYKLAGMQRTKLEALFHRIFAAAQLDLTIHDRFGHPVKPREWFLVPLAVIDEAVARIQDGSITHRVYDPDSAGLIEVSSPERR
ncbi:MAG: GIY-YIG nuclease family protein [Thiothrix sp.]|nr:GIY-YIG nuclease family protein [Thiothrix sp.]HPQ95770.1 GIY-YIG nuclease family protein [Thiolinea sp.]